MALHWWFSLKFRETCSILYKDDLSKVIYVPKLLSLVIEINRLKAQKTISEIVIKIQKVLIGSTLILA